MGLKQALSIVAKRMSSQQWDLGDDLFFHPAVLLSVVVFAANNFWWKLKFHNYLTGKLSDLTLCLFLPLYIAAILRVISDLKLKTRVAVGAALTAVVFSSVKLSTTFSLMLDNFLAPLGTRLWGAPSRNIVDSSDLVVLPIIALTYFWAVTRQSEMDEVAQS